MLEFVKGNLFEADVDALVNTVNTVGVMGRGVALQFSRQFPEIVRPYIEACKDGSLVVGKVQTIPLKLLTGPNDPKFIINFPTKRHWRGDSKMEYVKSGLDSLRHAIRDNNITSIAIPPLGCGLGGLEWPDVRELIVSSLSDLANVHIMLFEPAGAPSAVAMKPASSKPMMTLGRASLLGLIRRYMAPLMDDKVTLLEIHKLMYFMQEAGESLKLEYSKGIYGPYAKNMRNVLLAIEGHLLTGFGDGSEEPYKPIEPLPGAFEKAEQFLIERQESKTLDRFKKVADLINGFETAFGLELLGTVHWVATRESAHSTNAIEVTRLVHAWNPRKRRSFTPKHIEAAWSRLGLLGWL